MQTDNNKEQESAGKDEIFSDEPCKLCGEISNPDVHGGCDRADNPLCNWHIPPSINED